MAALLLVLLQDLVVTGCITIIRTAGYDCHRATYLMLLANPTAIIGLLVILHGLVRTAHALRISKMNWSGTVFGVAEPLQIVAGACFLTAAAIGNGPAIGWLLFAAPVLIVAQIIKARRFGRRFRSDGPATDMLSWWFERRFRGGEPGTLLPGMERVSDGFQAQTLATLRVSGWPATSLMLLTAGALAPKRPRLSLLADGLLFEARAARFILRSEDISDIGVDHHPNRVVVHLRVSKFVFGPVARRRAESFVRLAKGHWTTS